MDPVGLVRAAMRRVGLLHALDSGEEGERIAALFLRRRGYRVLGRNLRNRFGEIDLVVQAPDARTLVIVEVKTAAGDGDATLLPEVHVTPAKERKLAALASQLVRQFRLERRPIRFDVIGVSLPSRGKPCVRHHVAAFNSTF